MEQQKNMAAWDYLDQALFSSSHVSVKDMQKGSTSWDHVYPVSEKETDNMEVLVNQACQKADDATEPTFVERVNDLREIIIYSRAKHRTWKFSLIFGSLIAACIFWYFSSQDEETALKYGKDVALVENWQKKDTTIAYEKLKISYESDVNRLNYDRRYHTANLYKYYILCERKKDVESYLKHSKEYQSKADTATTADRKKTYQNKSIEYREKYNKYRAEFDEISKSSFDDVKKMALAETKGRADSVKGAANKKFAWMVYLVILIPLYIITGYPRGYMISRHRRQHGFMQNLRKWGFSVASFFFGAGLLMQLLPDDIVKYQYASGRTETRRENNPANFGILAMKFGLMVVGVLIFCFVSVLIMTVETFTGLKDHFVKT